MRHTALIALALLTALAASGCGPNIKGGVDATDLDPLVHPPRKRVLVTEQMDEPVQAADEAMQTDAEAPMEASAMAEADDREHLYIDKASGPVRLGKGKVYHWVAEGGELVVPVATAVGDETAMQPISQDGSPEPVAVIMDQAPDSMAVFTMDEVVSLLRDYERAMSQRKADRLSEIFSPDATLSFRMRVPDQGTLSETYSLTQFAETHRDGWMQDVEYDLVLDDITVTISDDGTTAEAGARASEVLKAKGKEVEADYRMKFRVEKKGQQLLFTGLEADGRMEASEITMR